MPFQMDNFKKMPQPGKIAVTLWIVGWVWLIGAYYYLTNDFSWAIKLSIAAFLLLIFLSQAQNWARLISVLANVMGIFLSGYFFLAGFILIATVNVILFGGAIYYFMVPVTAQYFQAKSMKSRGQDTQGPRKK